MSFERYTTPEHGLRVRVWKGLIWQPRFYCDDTNFAALPTYLHPYTRKAPVVHLRVNPLVNWVNETFNWDISASTSATSTLRFFDVRFNSAVTPDITGAEWATAPKSGTFTHNAAGFYTVEAQVEDILGEKSQIGSVMVEVLDRTQRLYIGTSDSGVFFLDSQPGAQPNPINTGLSGGHLKIRHLQLHPLYRNLETSKQHIWCATEDGVAFSTDGGQNWQTIDKGDMGTPENEVGDNPAPDTTDISAVEIEFSLLAPDTVFVTFIKAAGTTPARMWLYATEDYGATWSNQQVVRP